MIRQVSKIIIRREMGITVSGKKALITALFSSFAPVSTFPFTIRLHPFFLRFNVTRCMILVRE